ncbi:Ig-like domain-containing protein [Roseisolibacter sp. H3M3-2]|uniref:Ig-like domain-containing protein n=1 Tax=Roseisolibacter sp. H3M3-2 TaxID=3031323 RepID=UPI0023DABCC6|nr:Ig-like domain-containing protein [Roseisolibacter sp. H3M3-2]MDF1504556.1 Ig-like domain-containing protein [Roseisolibacter sp. H3M3-2]
MTSPPPPRLRPILPLVCTLAALAGCGGDGILVPRAPDFAVTPSVLVLAPGDTARLKPQLDLQPVYGGVLFLSRGTVATVTAAGVVTALSPGQGAVTAVAPDAGIIYTVPVTVRGVRLQVAGRDTNAVRLAPGRVTALDARVFGLSAGADSTVRWTSSDTSVAVVAIDGTLLARLPGRATVAATSSANPFLRAAVTVDVTPAARGAALALGVRAGDAPVADEAAVAGTVAAVVRADPALFPADARLELTLGGQTLATRPLGRRAVRVALPTAARDAATARARFPDGTRALVARAVARDGALLGRAERPLTLRNGGEE